jgi:Cu(I)/Ag(I) efflux system membrane fusion protein
MPHWSLFQSGWYVDFYRRHRWKIVSGLFVLTFVLGAIFSWFFLGRTPSPGQRGEPANVAESSDKGPTTWTCSMHPQIQQPKPGKCPLCGMDLIPVTKTMGGLRTISITPDARALMNIRTSPVERRYVEHEIRMVGKVDYNETRLGYITAWVSGRLDKMYVDFTGTTVRKGDHMVYLYSEELYTAQEELIRAIKFSQDRPPRPSSVLNEIDYVASAREKLRLLGMTEEQIKKIEQQSEPSDHMTIYSDTSGIVIEKLKQEGDRVNVGDRIYTIADLSELWVHLDAYEADLPWLKYGQQVTITTEAYPGDRFYGRINFVQKFLDDKTRTVKVRVNVPNAEGKLKPEMFVHATATAKVASGGHVMDPELAGKWISPMHPEIVKDEPGVCDVCGMPLVRAETLGYVAADTSPASRPLVIPYSAALVTGKRAVVYVELPTIQAGIEGAFQQVALAVEGGDLEKIHSAFTALGKRLDEPYNQPGTDYARNLWHRFADRLSPDALRGRQARDLAAAKDALAGLEKTMERVREKFAVVDQPTYEGREIVLGPRAGAYYLVQHGLEEGELVVSQGNFKIDAEVQIQAKPSMMTPEGGGGGGHMHGHGGAMAGGEKQPAEHAMSLPQEFMQQMQDLEAAYEQIDDAMQRGDLTAINSAFEQFGGLLDAVDADKLPEHPRMQWNEFKMLLGNDVDEGSSLEEMDEANRVFLLLKNHMRRLREQFKIKQGPAAVHLVEAPPEFRAQLLPLWQAYLEMEQALAADDFAKAQQELGRLKSARAAVDASPLSEHAALVWRREAEDLDKILTALAAAPDIKNLRSSFALLSEEMGVVVRSFGLGDLAVIYQLHCPMAFEGRGATWFQGDDQPRNPYYGSTMLKCADQVNRVLPEQPAAADESESKAEQENAPADHSQHESQAR